MQLIVLWLTATPMARPLAIPWFMPGHAGHSSGGSIEGGARTSNSAGPG